jgi:hypothetical protein
MAEGFLKARPVIAFQLGIALVHIFIVGTVIAICFCVSSLIGKTGENQLLPFIMAVIAGAKLRRIFALFHQYFAAAGAASREKKTDNAN